MSFCDFFDTAPPQLLRDLYLSKIEIYCLVLSRRRFEFQEQNNLIKELNKMPRKVRNAKADGSSGKPPFSKSGMGERKTRWVNADIRSKEHKSAIRALSAEVNDILDTLVELADEGYELIVKRTDAGSTVRAMLFCNIPGNVNQNGGLSSEAPDAWLALTTLIYKHQHLLRGVWFDDGTEDTEDDGWR